MLAAINVREKHALQDARIVSQEGTIQAEDSDPACSARQGGIARNQECITTAARSVPQAGFPSLVRHRRLSVPTAQLANTLRKGSLTAPIVTSANTSNTQVERAASRALWENIRILLGV